MSNVYDEQGLGGIGGGGHATLVVIRPRFRKSWCAFLIGLAIAVLFGWMSTHIPAGQWYSTPGSIGLSILAYLIGCFLVPPFVVSDPDVSTE